MYFQTRSFYSLFYYRKVNGVFVNIVVKGFGKKCCVLYIKYCNFLYNLFKINS